MCAWLSSGLRKLIPCLLHRCVSEYTFFNFSSLIELLRHFFECFNSSVECFNSSVEYFNSSLECFNSSVESYNRFFSIKYRLYFRNIVLIFNISSFFLKYRRFSRNVVLFLEISSYSLRRTTNHEIIAWKQLKVPNEIYWRRWALVKRLKRWGRNLPG